MSSVCYVFVKKSQVGFGFMVRNMCGSGSKTFQGGFRLIIVDIFGYSEVIHLSQNNKIL